MPARALPLAALAVLALVAADTNDLSDEEFYQLPRLFHLDHYEECLARRGVYCVGSFELSPYNHSQSLYRLMQKYSANEVENFNHTRLHRGLCVSHRCRRDNEDGRGKNLKNESLDAWFASCVNASTTSSYGLSARLYQLQYCERGAPRAAPALGDSERAFAAVLAALVALAAVSTVLDFTLSDQTKKSMSWALSWSVPGSWRCLLARPAAAAGGGSDDLATLDGLRVLGMLCFIVEHVCWLNTIAYIVDTRPIELMRKDADGILVSNSTLMVQAFFLMSSFLLANKLLQQQRRQEKPKVFTTIVDTVVNRVVRMSPSYLMVVWFAASWWSRSGRGPLWTPLVEAEAAICRRKWWTHLLYLNNVLYPDDKCLIQTWYLAADMQLYLCALALTLALGRWSRGAAAGVLGAALAASALLQLALALLWGLVPTFVLHRPEAVRTLYSGDATFNWLYQSPLGNAPGALAGLTLAHAHHALRDRDVRLHQYRWFRWLTWAAPWLAAAWVTWSPRLAGAGTWAGAGAGGDAGHVTLAALAAVERAVFALLVGLALLGAINGVQSPVRWVLSWRGWSVLARLSFGALLLHMIINKTLLAVRLAPAHLDRQAVVLEWFGVAVASYLAALPLALLVEIPIMRLYRSLREPAPAPRPQGKTDM